MCTRTLYVADDKITVITGRNMDWQEDMSTDLWVFPAGILRGGAAGTRSLTWSSRYGSVVASGYNVGTTDGLNEKGLAANLLYLAESDYGEPDDKRPRISISVWAQYVLDNFCSVSQAVTELEKDEFQIIAPTLPNGAPASLHMSLSDSNGDSAILEYINGKISIHHGKQYLVMTNSPTYEQQLSLNEYWKQIGGLTFLPGTNRAADRFVRASFLLGAIPKSIDPHYISGIPNESFDNQAIASMLSLQRAVSVPLGISTPGQPNISSTIWRSISDHKNMVYYFDSVANPNVVWVSLRQLEFKPGAPVKKLSLRQKIRYGEVSNEFVESEPFGFLVAH